MTLPNLLDALIEFAKRTHSTPLNKWEPLWEAQIDAHWWIAANAHRHPVKCSRGMIVQPFHFYIEFNGSPAGVIDATGRAEFAEFEAENLYTLAEALKKAA